MSESWRHAIFLICDDVILGCKNSCTCACADRDTDRFAHAWMDAQERARACAHHARTHARTHTHTHTRERARTHTLARSLAYKTKCNVFQNTSCIEVKYLFFIFGCFLLPAHRPCPVSQQTRSVLILRSFVFSFFFLFFFFFFFPMVLYVHRSHIRLIRDGQTSELEL